MRKLLLLTVLLVAPAEASVWDRLAGRWVGEGQVRGLPAAIDLTFRFTLDGRGRHLAFQNHMTMPDRSQRAFRAEALYLCDAAGTCTGHWYDGRGVVLPLKVATEAERVVVDWGDATTERGRTTYLVTAEGALDITDEVLGKDGAWKQFGRTRLSRHD